MWRGTKRLETGQEAVIAIVTVRQEAYVRAGSEYNVAHLLVLKRSSTGPSAGCRRVRLLAPVQLVSLGHVITEHVAFLWDAVLKPSQSVSS